MSSPAITLDLPASGERRYLSIARDLARAIDAGEHASGDRLPPERELATTLAVSRTTVREAVLALELMRYVEIRVGAGVYVLPASVRALEGGNARLPDESGPSEILEARRLIEGQTARRAAERASESELDAIAASIERMHDALRDVPRFDRADAEFHTLIARAAGNDLLAGYVEHLWQMRRGPLWERWYGQTRHITNRRRSIADHETIHQAMLRRSGDAAATAMHAHIDVLDERFFSLNL